MRPLLRFEDVTCRRGGRTLFENFSLKLGPGEAIHLTGPNGVGKSSIIRLAAGLLRPECGQIDRSAVALADDGPALDRELPLGRALAFWSSDPRAAMEALDLTKLAHVPVRLLSTGQAKRATLARVAASGAPLWLLDEPLNGLDAQGVACLEYVLASHLERGGAVLAASHGALGGSWMHMEISA